MAKRVTSAAIIGYLEKCCKKNLNQYRENLRKRRIEKSPKNILKLYFNENKSDSILSLSNTILRIVGDHEKSFCFEDVIFYLRYDWVIDIR